MLKSTITLSLVFLSMIQLSCTTQTASQATSQAPTEKTAVVAEWQSIFDGKSLDGWKIHGTEKWFVEEGELICESGPDAAYGYLATDKIYKDMELEVQFKQEADGNSGVFFRSSLDGTKITGWQAEVAPPGNDTGGIYESYGRGWLQQIPDDQETVLKMGEWNTLRIKVVGDHVQTWLNEIPRVDFHDEKIGQAEGSIALQIHDGGGIRVRWKSLRVKEL